MAAARGGDGAGAVTPRVEIPGQSTVFFHLSLVPAVVRSVEGRDVIWPLSSQPHLRIDLHDDGTLLIRGEYDEVVLAVSPEWLGEGARIETRDEKPGWPTVRVRPGTWRLQPDGRLTTGQWGDIGNSVHGQDDIFLYDNEKELRYAHPPRSRRPASGRRQRQWQSPCWR